MFGWKFWSRGLIWVVKILEVFDGSDDAVEEECEVKDFS